jgi:hypothetical protein
MNDSKMKAKLRDISSERAGSTLPDAAVACIHSNNIAEDGKTLVLMIDLADGTTAMISVCPGHPITCCVVA